MATTPIASQNVVVKAIQERHPNLTSGELYAQLRDMVNANIQQGIPTGVNPRHFETFI